MIIRNSLERLQKGKQIMGLAKKVEKKPGKYCHCSKGSSVEHSAREIVFEKDPSPSCRLCSNAHESAMHVFSECPNLAKKEYKHMTT